MCKKFKIPENLMVHPQLECFYDFDGLTINLYLYQQFLQGLSFSFLENID